MPVCLWYYAAGLGFLTAVVDYCGGGLPKALDAPDLHRRDISEGVSREDVSFSCLLAATTSSFVRDRYLDL